VSKHPHAAGLERVLLGLLAEERRLAALAAQHREALRRADGKAIERISAERSLVHDRIAALHQERAVIVRAMAAEAGLDTEPARLAELLPLLPAEQAAPLATLAARLRETVAASRQEHGVLREASEALGRHLAGVMSRIAELRDAGRTYTARGRIAAAGPVLSTLDIRS
jgi:hypothetical protein